MSNSYVKAAFAVRMSARDAALIAAAECATAILDSNATEDQFKVAYAELGPGFAERFPPGKDDPFAGFLEIFDDPDFPYLDCDIEIGEPEADGMCEVIFAGEQFGVEQVAELLFRAAKSALPCGFAYAYACDCDKLRLGEFEGGCVAITEDGITYHSTSRHLERLLAQAETSIDDGKNGFVLAKRGNEHGLDFWNNATGFGRLADATLFSDTEARAFDKPIADDEPEWMAMPAPIAA